MGLFIPSPNQERNLGAERDKFVPNPKALRAEDMQNYYMLGVIMGLCYKLGDIMGVNFPSIFWKYLLSKDLP